jgi:hypothetical protein
MNNKKKTGKHALAKCVYYCARQKKKKFYPHPREGRKRKKKNAYDENKKKSKSNRVDSYNPLLNHTDICGGKKNKKKTTIIASFELTK